MDVKGLGAKLLTHQVIMGAGYTDRLGSIAPDVAGELPSPDDSCPDRALGEANPHTGRRGQRPGHREINRGPPNDGFDQAPKMRFMPERPYGDHPSVAWSGAVSRMPCGLA